MTVDENWAMIWTRDFLNSHWLSLALGQTSCRLFTVTPIFCAEIVAPSQAKTLWTLMKIWASLNSLRVHKSASIILDKEWKSLQISAIKGNVLSAVKNCNRSIDWASPNHHKFSNNLLDQIANLVKFLTWDPSLWNTGFPYNVC